MEASLNFGRFLCAKPRHELQITQPFRVVLGPVIENAPPLPSQRASWLGQLGWALRLRWWHWRLDKTDQQPDIVVAARYQSSANPLTRLHSIGMPSPRLAIVNLATEPGATSRNQFVLAHEILHTVGANDHYVQSTGYPHWPDGYAEPNLIPRYPQTSAEIMGGRIPVREGQSRQAGSLSETIMSTATANTIGWVAQS